MKAKKPAGWKKLFDSEEFGRRYEYEGTDLGVTLHDADTVFKVWAPTAEEVLLNLYESGTEGTDDRISSLPMKRGAKGVWSANIDENLKNRYYTYTVTADRQTKETQDVYAIACGVNGRRSMIVDLRETDPDGWEEDSFCYDAGRLPVIYELHVKDFSFAESSGIPAEYRGKYKAFTVTDSVLCGRERQRAGRDAANVEGGECAGGDAAVSVRREGRTARDAAAAAGEERAGGDGFGGAHAGRAKPTCLAYLRELGITHVHLLPCFDFASVDEAEGCRDAGAALDERNAAVRPGDQGNVDSFNWGYDPLNFNVPEGSYATDSYDGRVRIREFKEMVQALHAEGIGVVMDVVYNHTFSMDSCFQRTVPYYYYRQNPDGSLSNGSGCGNETACERPMFRRYITESVCYWAREYHIDGFRFDLMGLFDTETMNGIRRALDALPGGTSILMYGEPWTAGSSALREGLTPAVKANVEKLDPRIAVFNDDTRDAVKGSVFCAKAPGFVNGGTQLKRRIRSSVLAWCDGKGGYQPQNPGQTITYVSAHDNWTLWDKLCYTMQDKPDFRKYDAAVLQANKFAAGIVLTSLGSVFFQAGEEAARTKDGIGDSYRSPADLNALDWERMYRYEDLMAYYKGMLAIRRSFSGYWRRDIRVRKAIRFYKCSERCVAFSFDALSGQDPWKRLWIVYSAREKDHEIRLPEAKRVLLSDGRSVFFSDQRESCVNGRQAWKEESCVNGPQKDHAESSANPVWLDGGIVPVTAGGVTVFGERCE